MLHQVVKMHAFFSGILIRIRPTFSHSSILQNDDINEIEVGISSLFFVTYRLMIHLVFTPIFQPTMNEVVDIIAIITNE